MIVARVRRRVAAELRARARRRAIGRAPVDDAPGVRPYYGFDRLPGRDQPAAGGIVKFQRLAAALPNEPRRFNLLYLGSSSLPPDAWQLVQLARQRGAAVAWNQNGVGYPAWKPRGWQQLNERLSRLYHAADHVFFQSEFCRLSAERFLGERAGPSEVLVNPVDTEHFTPGDARSGPLTLLLGGTQQRRYRVDSALRTLARIPDARLLVTGRLIWDDERAAHAWTLAAIDELGLRGRVELLGAYTQDEAPNVLRRAHLLLHTQYNDACPGLVLEALACGLPVVYSASGGVPELVGDAGFGVPAPLDWEREHPPAPEELAPLVERAAAERDELARRARHRAEALFGLQGWIARHLEVFRELTG